MTRSFDEERADEVRLLVAQLLISQNKRPDPAPGEVLVGGVAGVADYMARYVVATEKHEITDDVKREAHDLLDHFFDQAMKGMADA